MIMQHGDVEQSLLDASFTIDSQSKSKVRQFVTFANPHAEVLRDNTTELQIADCHCEDVSFGLPVALLDQLRQQSLAGNVGKFLNISGNTMTNARIYSFKITQGLIDAMAYSIFAVLSIANGAQFANDNMLQWQKWMK